MQRPKTATADGELGRFVGSASDEVVLGHYRRHGTWAPELLELLCRRLSDGGTFIDVGANIGLVSVPIAVRCPRAKVHAFEPVPDNYRCLQHNIAHHGAAQISTYPVAAFSRRAHVPMALCADNAGDHHLELVDSRAPTASGTPADTSPGSRTGPGQPTEIRVAADRLDAVLAAVEMPAPVVMKVDTQGAEVQVLRGAAGLLDRVDDLVIEYWPAGLRRCGQRASTLRQVLGSLGHLARGTLLDQNSDQPPTLTSTESLLERLSFFGDDDLGFFDLWLSRTS